MNYYNEWDKGAAAWLRELIKAGHIPQGDVDERSITEVTAGDLRGYTQCHFFAGIGGWSHALALAGIPATTQLWTGSPPCQPFSAAGKQLGQLDERHLAPTFMRLVDQCRPAVLFGEQVAAAIGKHWLDDLFTELERQGYACGAAVLPAASVGAPHKRDRLFFGAELAQPLRSKRDSEWLQGLAKSNSPQGSGEAAESTGCCSTDSVADTDNARPQRRQRVSERADKQSAGASGVAGGVGKPDGEIVRGEPGASDRAEIESGNRKHRNIVGASGLLPKESGSTNPHHGFWSDADWLGCRDGKFRPVEAWTQQMVDGVPDILGYCCDSCITEAWEEIKNVCDAQKTRPGEALQQLRLSYGAKTKCVESSGGFDGVHPAPVLLAFVRELWRKGREISESLPLLGEEAEEGLLRSLWGFGASSGAPCGRGLDEQCAGKSTDVMHILSPILARYASQAWPEAYKAYAEIGFPLGKDIPARVGRLRGYGNAIVPQVAAQFITAFMGACHDISHSER